ncbi:hypothetical protein KC19_8G047200 [Ceratodon purpureus]|uniref:Uncharacterized protein n=1 Tax=Ceratodon purpureus TaxID=3225 RepID=A0A8T0GYV7_CERPU|nr:hypothetical protein KC19_8G047200 [Ceratodon purpureus]
MVSLLGGFDMLLLIPLPIESGSFLMDLLMRYGLRI